MIRRARTLAADAPRMHRGRVRHGASLDDKLVFPAVAEVVLVIGQVAGLHQVTDPELLFVKRLEFIIGVRRAVCPAGDPE